MFGAFCVSLLLCEGIARLAAPQWQPTTGERSDFWVYDSKLGWAHRPNARGRFRAPDWDVAIAINSKGLRDVEHSYEHGAKRRLLILGDSFGWGYGVEQSEGVAARVAHYCKELEVINTSVSGYGTDQQYLYYQNEGRRYAPDIVLQMIYSNDMVENSCPSMYGYAKPHFVLDGATLRLQNVPVPEQTALDRGYIWFGANSYLVNGLLSATGMRSSRDIGCRDFDPKITGALLMQQARELGRDEVEQLWVLLPESAGESTRHELLYRNLAKRAEIPILDLAPALRSATEQGRALSLPKNSHWNAEGHRVAASAIAEALGCASDVEPTVGPEAAARAVGAL